MVASFSVRLENLVMLKFALSFKSMLQDIVDSAVQLVDIYLKRPPGTLLLSDKFRSPSTRFELMLGL